MTDKVLSTPPHVEPVVFTRDMLDWLPWLEPMAERHLDGLCAVGLDPELTPYAMRHTYASFALAPTARVLPASSTTRARRRSQAG